MWGGMQAEKQGPLTRRSAPSSSSSSSSSPPKYSLVKPLHDPAIFW
jgi:hypothetical protein